MANNYPLQHARLEQRRIRTSKDGERRIRRVAPDRGKDGRCRLGAVAPDACSREVPDPVPGRADRPPVKSTDRPDVAPRKTRDGKRKAQSPHPACGRFEAAHCAAHLATILASGFPVRIRDSSRMPAPTSGRHEGKRLNTVKPTRPTRTHRHDDAAAHTGPAPSPRFARLACPWPSRPGRWAPSSSAAR